MPKICCLKRLEIPKAWLPKTGSLSATDPSLSRLNHVQVHWKERNTVEKDPTFKQCIPYTLIESNGLIACYPRTGTETRLHELYSCGIGGHVEESDAQADFVPTLRHSLRREIREECELHTSCEKLQFLGIINEEISEVGRVHLGFVYLLRLNASQVPQTTEEISSIQWIDPQHHSCHLEYWSQLAIDLYLAGG